MTSPTDAKRLDHEAAKLHAQSLIDVSRSFSFPPATNLARCYLEALAELDAARAVVEAGEHYCKVYGGKQVQHMVDAIAAYRAKEAERGGS